MLFWARSKEIRELFYTPHYRLFPIAIKPQRDRSRKRVVRCSVPSSSLLTSPYCSLRLQAERPPGKTVVKSKGYLFPHRTKSFPTPAESCLKIKFNLYLNNLFKPLAPHRVRLRFIPFLCSLAIIWLIMVGRGPAEEWKICFSFPFLVSGGLHLVWPFMPLLPPHSPGLAAVPQSHPPSHMGPSCLQHPQPSQSCLEHAAVQNKC